jgi:hypothetical protein
VDSKKTVCPDFVLVNESGFSDWKRSGVGTRAPAVLSPDITAQIIVFVHIQEVYLSRAPSGVN